MAKHTVIVPNPKTKKSPKRFSNRHQKASHTSGKVDYVKRSKGKRYTELPPGPENFVVRTPYPVAPSEEDKTSK